MKEKNAFQSAVQGLYGLEHQIWRARAKIVGDAGLTPKNRDLILQFVDYAISANSLSPSRVKMYLTRLPIMARVLGVDFDAASKADLIALAARLREHKCPSGKLISPATLDLYRILLRRFYKWLEGNDEEYPEKVRWWKAPRANGNGKLRPEDLLTEAEVNRLVAVCGNDRDRALVAVLAEGGFRVGEAASMRVGSVMFDELGARVSVNGKTGQRSPRLITSVPYLRAWLGSHPLSGEADAPLWVCLGLNKGLALPYAAYRAQLRKISVRAGVCKRCNPHAFRHYAATRLFNLGVPNEVICSYLGWVPGTKMQKVYSHISGKDIDRALAEANGVVKPEALKRNACPRCYRENGVAALYCVACGSPLKLNAAFRVEERDARLMELTSKLLDALDKDEGLKERIASLVKE